MRNTANGCATGNRFNPAPLRRARRLGGWTYSRLGHKIGKTAMTVRSTLLGQTSAVKTVADLAEALGVDVTECWPE